MDIAVPSRTTCVQIVCYYVTMVLYRYDLLLNMNTCIVCNFSLTKAMLFIRFIFVGGAQRFSGGSNLIDPMGFMNGIITRHCFALLYASVAFEMLMFIPVGYQISSSYITHI